MIDLVRESSFPTPLAYSPLLPIVLLSLSSQKNSPSFTKTPFTVLPEYDFIVVGAGSAGSTVSSRLSELPCVNVLLLEAGSAPPLLTDIPAYDTFFWNSSIDWYRLTVPQKHAGRLIKNRQFAWPNGKALGGTSIINGMEYVRGNKKDYDNWASNGAKGWSYREVLPYFKKMEDNKNLDYVANGYHGVGGPITVEDSRYNPEIKEAILDAAQELGYKILDPNGPHQTSFSTIQSTVRNAQRCSTAKGYLVPAENRQNFDILPNAFVRKVIIQNKKAVGVTFEVDNTIFNVRAKKEVIVSAGTVASAQLLMLSGIGPQDELQKHKIPVIADLPVGLNLHDHFIAGTNFRLDPRIPTVKEKFSDPENIMEYLQYRTGLLSGGELMAANAFLKDNLTYSVEDFPNFQLIFSENTADYGNFEGLTESAFNQVYGPYIGSPFYTCSVFLLHPRSRGIIKLLSSNPRDPPLIDPNYLAEEQDVKSLVEGMKVCRKIGESRAMQKVGSKMFTTSFPGCETFRENIDDYFKCQIKSFGRTGVHYVGTVKMGSRNDPTTVVDSHLKVKDIQSLRVVDASIMPTVPSGNTNAPTIMIAEKASDLIKQEIKCGIFV